MCETYISMQQSIGPGKKDTRMPGQTSIQSAKILAFPAGGRKSVTRSALFAVLQNDNRQALPVVDTDGWYHEAAMADETRDRTN